jgi:dTDP-4-dehydrorhamnose reductase
MKIAVTGGPGQLVLSMLERGPLRGHEVVAVGPPELDLAAPDDDAIHAAFAASFGGAGPDVIVNAAAHTAVDKAEGEAGLAHAINGAGAGAVARAAAALGVPVVQVSTDYVFAGDKPAPYVESDATGPTGVYGASKLAGEQAVAAAGGNYAILRTAWVYSPFGANFIKTMLRLAETRDELGVVADQYGCPTSALDLADACIVVAENLVARPDPDLRGLFHATGSGEGSWADFAEAIFAASSAAGGPSADVKRITTAEFPTPARRPANSRLDCAKLAAVHGVTLPDWRVSTRTVVARLIAEAG